MKILGKIPSILVNDDTARKLLEEELSQDTYKKRLSIYEIIMNFLNDLFHIGNRSTSLTRTFIDWLIIIIFIIIVSSIIYIIYKIKKKSKLTKKQHSFLDNRSYYQLMLSAKNAANKQKNYTLGTLESYRAIIKYLNLCGKITISSNMTPNEVCRNIIKTIPEFEKEIQKSTDIFNEVMYAKKPSNYAEYILMQQLLTQITEKYPIYDKQYEGFGYGGIH